MRPAHLRPTDLALLLLLGLSCSPSDCRAPSGPDGGSPFGDGGPPGPPDAAFDAGDDDAGGFDAGEDTGVERVRVTVDPSPDVVAAADATFLVEAPFTNMSVNVSGDGVATFSFDQALPPFLLAWRLESGVATGVAVVPLPAIDGPQIVPPPDPSNPGVGHTYDTSVPAYVPPAALQGRFLREGVDGETGHGGLFVAVVGRPFRTVTHPDGRFVLDALPPGPLDLVAWAPGLRPVRVNGFVLAPGERRYLDTSSLPVSTAEEGRVAGEAVSYKGRGGTAQLRAVAYPLQGEGAPAGLTLDAEGTYEGTLPAGLYEVRAESFAPDDLEAPVQACRLPHVVVDEGTLALPSCAVYGSGLMAPPLEPVDGGTPDEGWDERWNPEGPPTLVVRAPSYVLPGSLVQFDASESHGHALPAGVLLDFTWRQLLGEPVPGGLSATDGFGASRTSFRAPTVRGSLTFTLDIRDARNDLDADATLEVKVVDAPTLELQPGTRQVVAGSTTTFHAEVDAAGLPVTVRWTSRSGVIPGLLVPATGPDLTVTAPTAPGSYPIDVEAIVGDEVRTSGSVVIVVSEEPFAPQLFVGADRVVGSGTRVTFAATAFGTEPMEVRWAQVSGDAVELEDADTTAPSFVAPGRAGVLRFRATASNPLGSSTADLVVTVADVSPPVRVGGDPVRDEGPGPWLALYLDYDEPLDPATVGSGNVLLRDPFTNTVDATVTYDATRRRIHVLPRTPLEHGVRYQLRVVGLRDLAFPPNEAPVEVIDFTTREPTWTTWAAAATSTAPTAPGLVVRPGSSAVRVVAGRDTPTCRGSWWLDPQPDGTLQEPAGAPCVAFDPTRVPLDRRGLATPGAAYAFLEPSTLGEGGLVATVEGNGPATFAPALSGPFTDATTLYSVAAVGTDLRLRGFVGDTWGSPGEVVVTAEDAGADALEAATGTAIGGQLYTAAIQRHGTSRRLLVRRRTAAGTWEVLAGRRTGQSVSDTIVEGTAPRAAPGRRDPMVAALVTDGATRRLFVGAFDSRLAPGSWTTFPDVDGPSGGATAFDLALRGDAAFLPVVADGRLRLRRLDPFSAFPLARDVTGPAGAVLNVDAACTAGHPEILSAGDRLWLTWHERCGDGAYRTYLRSIE